MYLISSEGLIYNSTGNLARYFISNTGYYRINLMCIDGTSRNFSVHILTASTFIDKPCLNEPLIINHKDGNKLNNDVSNLEWCTYKENWEHANSVLKSVSNYGETAFMRKKDKYPIEIVYAICEKLSERYYKANELIVLLNLVNDPSDRKSEEYRNMKKFIKNIRQRRCWKSISKDYIWGK